MSDPSPGRQLTLGAALRALPPLAPGRDGWSALAVELAPAARRPAPHRFALRAALAAGVLGVAAALLLLRSPQHPATPLATAAPPAASNVVNDANAAKATNAAMDTTAQGVTDGGDGESGLLALENRSQALERWLHDTRDAASPLPGPDLAAATEIENLIGLVDVELSSTSRKEALPLWRRRVNLLEDLTALRYSNYRLAETMLASSTGEAPNRIN